VNAVLKSPVGDYDLRGKDYDTAMICAITSTHIGADRRVRRRWSNGFPNWWLSRVAYCGDNYCLPQLKDWVVAFSVAYCVSGGVRSDAYSDELAYTAGMDALYLLIYGREMDYTTSLAKAIGVRHSTYKRVRNCIYARLAKSLEAYWELFAIEFRETAILERNVITRVEQGILKVRESFISETDMAKGGSGNYIRQPATDSDNL
jgi:hypothetical protein